MSSQTHPNPKKLKKAQRQALKKQKKQETVGASEQKQPQGQPGQGAAPAARFGKLDDATLEELAKDPQNLVYRYVDLPKPKKNMPTSQVRKICFALREDYRELRRGMAKPDVLTPHQVDRARKILKRRYPVYHDFVRFHSNFFEMIVSDRFDDKHWAMVLRTIELKELEREGKIKGGKFILRREVTEAFAKDKDEYLKENPDSQIIAGGQ